jgi:hypothetical protein
MRAILSAVALCLPLAFFAGCDNKPAPKPDVHTHDHGDHEMGPHDGHLLELGEEEYHAEWTHDDESGKVTIYILDGEGKKEVPIDAESLTINTTIKGETTPHSLEAVNATSGDKPLASQFEITDKALVTTLKAIGKDVSANLEVKIKDKTYPAKFEAHEEHEHGGHKD